MRFLTIVQNGITALSIAILLAACGGGDSQTAQPASPAASVYVPPPPPPPPPPSADAILTMRFQALRGIDNFNGLQCFGERSQYYYYSCGAPSQNALVAADFDVRVAPGSLTETFGITAESVRSATLTLVLGPEYGSKTLVVPVINMEGYVLDKETYWCAENTKCDRWWWDAFSESDGTNTFRGVQSWVDESTGQTIGVALTSSLFHGDTGDYIAGIVVTLRGSKETKIVLSGPLVKE